MLNRENMGETCGKVADLFGETREGLTVREAARALKSPENTIDFHVRMLVAAGNLVKVGKASIEDLGRPGYVYADRKHVSTSKAWIAKNEKERAAGRSVKHGRAERAEKAARAEKPKKAKPSKAKAKKPAKSKAKKAPAKKPAKPAPKAKAKAKPSKKPPTKSQAPAPAASSPEPTPSA